VVDCVWNVMAHAQKQDFVFRRNGRIHLNRQGRQFSRLLAVELWASAVVMVVMLDTPCSEVVWRVLATHSMRQFPLYFPPPPCVIVCHHVSVGLYLNCLALDDEFDVLFQNVGKLPPTNAAQHPRTEATSTLNRSAACLMLVRYLLEDLRALFVIAAF